MKLPGVPMPVGMVLVRLVVASAEPVFCMVAVKVTDWPGVTVLLVELLLRPTTRFGVGVTDTVIVGADAGSGV